MVTLQTCSTVLLLQLPLTMYCYALHFGQHQAQLQHLFCASLHMVLLSHNVFNISSAQRQGCACPV